MKDNIIGLYRTTWKCKSKPDNIKHNYWASSMNHCVAKKIEVQKDDSYIPNSFTVKGSTNVKMTKQGILDFINNSVLELI